MTEQMHEALELVRTWWPSYAESTRRLFVAVLASLPGGEDLADAWGEEAITINLPALGWLEAGHLSRILSAIDHADDVRALAAAILEEEHIGE